MKLEISVPSFAGVTYEIEGQIAAASTGAMRDTMPDAKQELRDQVVSAGLGTRLANTWRGDVYPKSAKSMRPAGFIHSNAPLIVDSFLRGAQIVPIAGGKYLAIPTNAVPASRRGAAIGAGRRGRGAGSKMSPSEVEAVFGQTLIIKPGRNGHLLAFIDPNLSGGRRATRRKGQSGPLVLMFTLVKSVRLPKLLDLDGPAQRWASAFSSAMQRRLGI